MEKKKMKLGRREVSIPHEIMFEIFSWLPVKSLMRFKCVSGLCNSLVFESDFLNIHRCRSMTCPARTKFLLPNKKGLYSAKQKEDGNISASLFQTRTFPADSPLNCANGLFCVWDPSTMRPAMIFSPSTREVRFLPDPNKGSYSHNYLLGFEPEENKYKVFFISKTQGGYINQWVLTLGIDESWRETQSILPYNPYGKSSICISGVIYQLVRANKCAIAAFDVKSENFEIITMWNRSDWVYYYQLIEVKGKLAVMDYHRVKRSFYLWILEHSPKREWKRHNIRFPLKWDYKLPTPIPYCTSRDGKIVFIRNSKSGALCWCYDFNARRRKWRKLDINGLPEKTRIHSVYSYVDTLDRII